MFYQARQVRQVRKFSRHGFSEKGACQEDIAMLIALSCSNPTENELDQWTSELWETGRYIRKFLIFFFNNYFF